MDRDIHQGSSRNVFHALLFSTMFPVFFLVVVQPLVAATLSTERFEMPHSWLHQVQSDEPLSPEQRDVLEELLDTPAAADLKAVFELYLNRNRKMTDKDFETFSKILNTARELEVLEGQKDTETQEAKERPDKDPEAKPIQPEPSVETDRSAQRENDEQPSAPTVDLEFLYHDAKPMRPL